MSNPYPPTPSFGGAYAGYAFTDAGLRDGGLQMPSGGPPAPQYRAGGYSSGAPTNPAPAMNNQSFQANATISNATHPSIPPPPFHVSSDFFKQFAHTTLPPPPYPPVPIPHLGFPQFPPPPPSFTATSTPPNSFLTNSSLPHQGTVQPAARLLETPQYPQDSFMVTREEGELSDGDLNKSSQESMVGASRPVAGDRTHLSVMPGTATSSNHLGGNLLAHTVTSAAQILPADSESAVRQTSNTSRGTFSSADIMGNVFQRQSPVEDDRIQSADNESISSYNPPSASTPDPEEVDMESIEPHTNGIQRADSSMPPKENTKDSAILVLREQVKDALRSLALHKIKYNELVGEGVDPRLLQTLYQDLGHNVVLAKLSSPTPEGGQVAETQNINLQSQQPAQDLPHPSSNGVTKVAITKDIGPSVVQSKSASEIQTAPKVADSSKPPVSVATTTEKSSAAPSPSNVAMERKDRIAQLLAAKTGKAIPPRPIPGKETIIQAEDSKPLPVVEAAEKPISLPEKPPVLLTEPLVKPKNKAQTELIRQKMEALRKEALAKSQVQGTTKESCEVSSPAVINPSPTAQTRKFGSIESTAVDGLSELRSQIPGLFMTSEPHPSYIEAPNGRSEDTQMGKLDDPISVSSTASSVDQDAPAMSVQDPVHSPGGHILPVRLPQKRPLASDSFDEPMPSLKRPFGQKASHDKVEIVLSDPESEGEVEDVEMELDEESDEEKQAPQAVVIPAVSRRETGIRNMPPLTDVPSPKSIAQIPSGVATPASTAVQTPGREKDKEELWKAKHQEIELMRKKIAEMEERRKAKQSATRAISPKAPAKASMPIIRTSLARPSHPLSPGLPYPPAAAKIEVSSDGLQSPVLAASRPAELPSTPSTPLNALREPLKAEDLRHQLLRRKTTREVTPGTAELELRQAQLAEKREKLAALKREAERREAEILEEAKLLEAQLQSELNGQEHYEDPQPNPNNDLEGSSDAAIQDALVSLPKKPASPQGTIPEYSFSATDASLTIQPERALGEENSQDSPADANAVLRHPNADPDLVQLVAFSRELKKLNSNMDEIHQLENRTQSEPTEQQSASGTTLQEGVRSPVPDTGNGPVFPPPSEEDNSTTDVRFYTVGPDLVDEDGSVSMSDSNSDDYEPAEPSQIEDDKPDDISEHYEPAELITPADTTQPPTSKQNEVISAFDSGQPGTGAPQESMSPATRNLDQQMLLDDEEDGMQLTEPDIINKPQITSQSHQDEINDKQVLPPMSHFTPYQTPRTYFKNFRYHDRFPEIVSSGYKSLTFSNNIDPKRPFCPAELGGQACEDPTCEEQHFRQVELTDDKILAQMSTANNLKTKAEHERWVAGLRQVIADLRSRGVKDFHMVASALAAYRRRFSEELSTPASASTQS